MATTRLAITHKRGDTFSHRFAVSVPITDWTITSQIRDSADTLVSTPTLGNRDDAAGTFTLTVSDTTAWAPGTLVWDVQCVDADSITRSTQTVYITVIADVTRA